jgi:exodeoxyribonuclease-3
MRAVSWNVNGIRAIMKKDSQLALDTLETDVLCIQETKAQDDQVMAALAGLDAYSVYSNSAVKKGYSGTAILTKMKPLDVRFDLGKEEHDQEGRVLALEFENFILVNVYTPNSGTELKRLEYRQRWDADFLTYLKKLEKKKPLIVCGDLNVAHRDIDLARPKQNYNKTACYMQEEIDGLNNILAADFIDTFRYKKGKKIKYSWWSYRAGARKKNIGWRIDYFLVSPTLADKVQDADILDEIPGSDHCPIVLDLKV